MAKKDKFENAFWSIYITDEDVVKNIDKLCKKVSMSRNKMVESILKVYTPKLLQNDKELLSLLKS